ncbi:replication factor C large subunit [Candidatus Woesearchaeota archaeon]|nr:replication factor C large subunit [Candidatus Woesearchaeota archaeon]
MGGQPWIKKYSPSRISEVIGQDSAMSMIKEFVNNYKKQKKKALLIYGASGCGKTSSVYALASELNLEIVEMNASDFRNKDQINSIAGAASQQMSLFGGSKVILIDELDGIAGRQDFGGVASIAKLISESKFPIIMTINNPYNKKFSSIRSKCELLQFKELGANDIFLLLKRIVDKEGIIHSDDSLKRLARRNSGDARGAINDLQILTSEGKLDEKTIDELSERNRTENMLQALVKVFKSTDPSVAVSAFDNVEEDLDQCALWLDENLPKEYTNPEDLARAYDKLSKADVFKRRIRRWQHWRFLVYINSLLTAGVAVSKDSKNKKFIPYKPTGRILKMWWAKQKSMKKKAIAEKLARKTHSSIKEQIKTIDYFKQIFKNDKEMAKQIADYLDLDKEEVAWLKK